MLSGMIICHKGGNEEGGEGRGGRGREEGGGEGGGAEGGGGGGHGNYTCETAVISHSRWWFHIGTMSARSVFFPRSITRENVPTNKLRDKKKKKKTPRHAVWIVNIFPGEQEKSRVEWLKELQLHTSGTFCAMWQKKKKKLDKAVCPTSKGDMCLH